MENLVPYLLSLVLAFLVESFTEYIFGTPMDKSPKLAPFKWALMYISAAFGIGVAFYYRLDLVALIQDTAGVPGEITAVGIALTGLGIGRGSNWLHQFMSRFFPTRSRTAYKPITTNSAIYLGGSFSDPSGDKGITETLTDEVVQ